MELRVTGLADISALDEEKDIATLRSIAGKVCGHSARGSGIGARAR